MRWPEIKSVYSFYAAIKITPNVQMAQKSDTLTARMAAYQILCLPII